MRVSLSIITAAVLTTGCGKASSPIEVEEAFTFPSVLGNMAGFLTIRNNTGTADTLLSLVSEEIDSISIHRTERQGALGKMVPQPNLPIPAKGVVKMRSGEIHLMMTGFDREYRQGDSCRMVATFAKAGKIPLTAIVKDFGTE